MDIGLLLCRMMAQPGRANKRKRRIACIGDSIPFGAGVQLSQLGNRGLA